MRNSVPAVFLAATLTLTAPIAVRAQSSDTASPLPVRAVTLFSSGVGFTQREGQVDGSATVPLTFRTAQINDILKSLVLLDENGSVRPAVYAAKDPIGRTLQSFAVDVTQPSSRAELLNKLRGAKVTVQTNASVTIEGQIVGVESVETAVGDKAVQSYVLTVLGDGGLQSVNMNDVRAIKLADERLNREFREALTLLASGADDRRRQVTLHFEGNGKRKVSVGYVSEAPLWKVSYRLLIGGAGKPGANGPSSYIQSWALVENTSDDDWTNVRLSLISGRPVSFIQDLYQPLYLPRPVVPPDVVASPFPQLAETDLENKDRDAAIATNASPPPPAAPAMVAEERRSTAAGSAAFGGNRMAKSARGMANTISSDADNSLIGSLGAMRGSVSGEATGTKAGELFAYNITTPVTLPRQQAAMIPIIAQDIAGDKVSLYNADTDARFPMNAFRLKNNTGLHLKGGPVTLFDDGVYAGDARMEDVPPGDERLIPYAVDLSVEGERQGTSSSGLETSLRLRRGVLTITRRYREETHYLLKNKAAQARTILVEHPFNSDYKLVAPEKFDSRTAGHYRFAVVVAPGKSEKLSVITERPVFETVAILDADLDGIEAYTKRGDFSEKVKATLREVLTRRRHVQELQSQAATAEAEVASIDKDQERIRKNMAALDKSSALYKRYVTQLDDQETRIQALRTEANRLRTAAAAADRELRAWLDTLVIDPDN